MTGIAASRVFAGLVFAGLVFAGLVFAGLILAGACGGPSAPDPAPPSRGPTPSPATVLRDCGGSFQGYAPTWLVARRQRVELAAREHVVSLDLPPVPFGALHRVMLTDGDPVVADAVRALEGQRVRIRGYALPLDELTDAKAFVLHDAPFVRCVHVATPATNRQVLVRLADDTRFDFTDAPLLVEGVLRVGRFETFEDGDVALFALDQARVQVLPLTKEDMVIGFEHGPVAHEGEVHLPARSGAGRSIDPGAHGHGHQR